jgi:hypothetical protein
MLLTGSGFCVIVDVHMYREDVPRVRVNGEVFRIVLENCLVAKAIFVSK